MRLQSGRFHALQSDDDNTGKDSVWEPESDNENEREKLEEVVRVHDELEAKIDENINSIMNQSDWTTKKSKAQMSPPEDAEIRAAAEAKRAARPQPPVDSNTEPDDDADTEGSGWCARGPPMLVGFGLKQREFQNRAGLCSPGLWAPADRELAKGATVAGLREDLLAGIHDLTTTIGMGAERLIVSLAGGKVTQDPFLLAVKKAQEALVGRLAASGFDARPRRVGLSQPMPACPHSGGVQEEPPLEPRAAEGPLRSGRRAAARPCVDGHYISAKKHAVAVDKVLREQAERGQVLILPKAEDRRRYGADSSLQRWPQLRRGPAMMTGAWTGCAQCS